MKQIYLHFEFCHETMIQNGLMNLSDCQTAFVIVSGIIVPHHRVVSGLEGGDVARMFCG
jgi:hypothetical protein